jgi:hypothetical protein
MSCQGDRLRLFFHVLTTTFGTISMRNVARANAADGTGGTHSQVAAATLTATSTPVLIVVYVLV